MNIIFLYSSYAWKDDPRFVIPLFTVILAWFIWELYTGKIIDRGFRVIYKEKEPIKYWFIIIVQFIFYILAFYMFIFHKTISITK